MKKGDAEMDSRLANELLYDILNVGIDALKNQSML